MTTAFTIDKLLKNEKKFTGVYLYDQINSIKKLLDEVIIINYITTKEAQEGKIGHYVVLDNRYNQKKNNNYKGLYFFDPYGFPPDIPRILMNFQNTNNIKNLINRTASQYEYNTYEFQILAPWDKLCGIYSTLFVINPNFKTNKIFNIKESKKMKLTQNITLEQIFSDIHAITPN